MDRQEYFERVTRFLETKGWNTSNTQINESTYVITGTRESETYYDRMLTMVAVDEETAFTAQHIEYLVTAGDENDVDHLMATCRGGLDEEATELASEYGVQFIDTETIDGAFLDEFSIEDSAGIFEQARARRAGLTSGGPFGKPFQYLLALYLLVGISTGVFVAVAGGLVNDSAVVGSFLPATILVLGPALAIIGALSLAVNPPENGLSFTALFLGSGSGYLLLVVLLGASASVVGEIGSVGLFSPREMLLSVLLFAVPTAGLGVIIAVVYDQLFVTGHES